MKPKRKDTRSREPVEGSERAVKLLRFKIDQKLRKREHVQEMGKKEAVQSDL